MIVLQAMAVLIEWPFLALVPVAVFGVLFLRSRRWIVLSAGLLWTLYLPYELAMKYRILCSGECNIRVDLLVIYPVLIGVSLIALASALLGFRRPGSRERGAR